MAETLVLLHPLGVDGSCWLPLRAHLDGRVALTPDLPGHGTTPPLPAGADLSETAAAVLADLDRAGVEMFDLVGVSLGGLIAQQLAALVPDRIDHLVLVDTVQRYPEPMREMWRQRAGIARTDGMTQLLDPTLALWFSAEFRNRGGDVVHRTTQALQSAPTEGYARSCELLSTVDARALAHRITSSTLVLCGLDDAEPFRQAAVELEAAIPSARLAWLPGRHAAAFENSEAFAELLEGFLREPTNARPTSAETSSTGGAL